MTEQEKQPFINMQLKDKERHERQMKEFEDKGYYIRDDGTKSNDNIKAGDKRKSKASPEKKGVKKSNTKKVADSKTMKNGKNAKNGKHSSTDPQDEESDTEWL